MALDAQSDAHWQDIRTIHHQHRDHYAIAGGVFLVIVFAVIGWWVADANDWPEYWQNFYMTIIGAILTVVVLDRLNARRAKLQRKRDLTLQLGSPSNDFALEAKRLLELEGWLEEALKNGHFERANWQSIVLEGSDLTNTKLPYANLSGAKLRYTNLSRAILTRANLSGAELICANLSSAVLSETNLLRSKLYRANLSGAHLFRMNLSGASLNFINLSGARLLGNNLSVADLSHANLSNTRLKGNDLSGARLDFANLSGAILHKVKLENSTLPDGTIWTPDTDMKRFTDPTHPDFWRSNNHWSPAYRGKP